MQAVASRWARLLVRRVFGVGGGFVVQEAFQSGDDLAQGLHVLEFGSAQTFAKSRNLFIQRLHPQAIAYSIRCGLRGRLPFLFPRTIRLLHLQFQCAEAIAQAAGFGLGRVEHLS